MNLSLNHGTHPLSEEKLSEAITNIADECSKRNTTTKPADEIGH